MIRYTVAFGLVAATGLTGCFVPESKYDQAVHTLRAEQSAHRETAERLYQMEQKLAYANGILEKEHAKLSAQETTLAQSELDVQVAATEREDASRMVDQLRGELARVGDHMRAFSEQKSNLETALVAAESRAAQLEQLERDFAIKSLLVRDLTFALHDDVGTGDAAISVIEGDVHVRLDAAKLFDGISLRPEQARALQRIAAAVGPVGRTRVAVTEHPAEGYQPEDALVRLQGVADVLSESGIPFERVTLALPSERSAGEPTDGTDGDLADEPEPVTAEADPKAAAGQGEGVAQPTPAKAHRLSEGPGSLEIAISLAPPPQKKR
jgi:hypothetical protein